MALIKLDNQPPPSAVRAASERFWKKVEKPRGEGDACWLWTSTTRDDDGTAVWLFNHGQARYRLPAHRAALIIQGMDLTSDDVAFRKCRNAICVNPEHLGVGGHEQNVAARGEAGNTARGSENGRAKLTEEDVADIKLMLHRGATIARLAERYGVAYRAIWGIKNDRVWKHVAMASDLRPELGDLSR